MISVQGCNEGAEAFPMHLDGFPRWQLVRERSLQTERIF
jgi:hypothetical protein